MAHWLQKVVDLLQSDDSDLRALAKAAGGDPRTFYLGTDLSGADLRGQDLRGMNFTNLDLAKVQFDENTILDQEIITSSQNKDEKPASPSSYPSTPDDFYSLGIELRKIKRFTESLAVFDRGIEAFPENMLLRLGKADTLIGNRDLQRAWYEVFHAITLFPHSEQLFQLATRCYWAAPKRSDALYVLDRGAKRFPSNRRILLHRAKLIALVEPQLGIRLLEEYIARWHSAEAISALIQACINEGQYDLMLPVVAENLTYIANSRKAIRQTVAAIVNAPGDISDLLNRLEFAAKASFDAGAARVIAELFLKLKMPARAVEVLEAADAADPSTLVLKKHYSRALIAAGLIGSATKILSETLELHPGEIGPYKWLAEVYAEAGRVKLAIELCHVAYKKFDVMLDMREWGITPDDIIGANN
jgi:predicted Zn-dependent protease